MAAEAIKSFICPSEIPRLSQEGGQADFLQKVESLLSFSSPRAFLKWTEFDKQNLAGTRHQLGLLQGSETSTGLFTSTSSPQNSEATSTSVLGSDSAEKFVSNLVSWSPFLPDLLNETQR